MFKLPQRFFASFSIKNYKLSLFKVQFFEMLEQIPANSEIIKIIVSLKAHNLNNFWDLSKKIYEDLNKIQISPEKNIFENVLIIILPQSPANGDEINVEIEFLNSNETNFKINKVLKKINSLQKQTISIDEYETFHTAMLPDSNFNFVPSDYENKMRNIFLPHTEKNNFELFRVWNFIGGIIEFDNFNSKSFQRYQNFNNSRYKIFDELNIQKFPASTGIGCDFNQIFPYASSIKKNENLISKPLANNNQIDAFDYSKNILVGKDDEQKYPPLFSRGWLLDDGNKCQIFVSGTSSILGEKSESTDKVLDAAILTINNIKNVCSQENIFNITKKNYPNSNAQFQYFKVYIKDKIFLDIIEPYLKTEFPNSKFSFLLADICRDELLIEIEAYFESHLI